MTPVERVKLSNDLRHLERLDARAELFEHRGGFGEICLDLVRRERQVAIDNAPNPQSGDALLEIAQWIDGAEIIG